MTSNSARNSLALGVLAGATSAFCYSLTIIFGRHLALAGFEGPTVLGIRFGLSALLTLGLLAMIRGHLLPEPGERVRAVLLGAIGYAVESSFFYAGLQHGSAAAVALVFYSYPAIVAVAERNWAARTALALGLSSGGTVLVVATGGGVSISAAGIVFSLIAAATFAAYLIAGQRLVVRTNSMTSGAWVAAGAAASLLLRGLLTGSLESPSGQWPVMIANGAASAAAFALLFSALRLLGAGRTAIVMTLEAVFAVLLGAAFLNEALSPVQLLGGAAILAATVLTATDSRDHSAAPRSPGPATTPAS